ncbi:MAG: lysophospholipid acyltransferase family protein [Dehalococcoidia bacterium]
MTSWLSYGAFRATIFVLRGIPLRISYGIARGAGALAYYAWPGGRRRCIQNMRRVAGGDARRARSLARRSFGNYLVYLVDFFRFFGTDAREVDRRVTYAPDLWERLRDRRRGKGIVFMTIHLGNWDMGAALLARNGFPISAIADEFPNERLNRFVIGSREHLGMKVIPAGRMGPGILRALANDDVVAMLVDVPQREGGVAVEFFGATVRVPDGPARIALRAGSSVVAATVPRVTRWSDRVAAVIAPVEFTPTGEQERDVQALTQAVFRNLEDLVRRDPAQWYIFRNLWVADREPAAAEAQPA